MLSQAASSGITCKHSALSREILKWNWSSEGLRGGEVLFPGASTSLRNKNHSQAYFINTLSIGKKRHIYFGDRTPPRPRSYKVKRPISPYKPRQSISKASITRYSISK